MIDSLTETIRAIVREKIACALARQGSTVHTKRTLQPVDGSPGKRLFNTREAAEYCGLKGGAKSMRNLKYLGTGPKWHRIGRVLVYYASDLDDWIEARLDSSWVWAHSVSLGGWYASGADLHQRKM